MAPIGDRDQKEWIRREKNKREQKKKKRETASHGEDELFPLNVFFSFFPPFFFPYVLLIPNYKIKKNKNHMQNCVVLMGLTAAVTDL